MTGITLEQYVPTKDNELDYALHLRGALFYKTNTGEDWYDYIKKLSDKTAKIITDVDGVISACSRSAERMLVPSGYFFHEVPIENVPDELFDMTCGALKYVHYDGVVFENREWSVHHFKVAYAAKMRPITNRINFITEAMEDGDATPEEISELASLKQRRSVLRRITPEMVESDGWPE